MPNINLIAVRRADKKRLEKNTRRLFLGIGVEMTALVLLGSYIGARQWQMRDALAEADAQIARLQPTLDRIAQIEEETSLLKPKCETLVSAKADTLRWRAMLQIVSQSIPGNAWLTGITSTGAAEDTTITIAGNAGSQTLVGETMTRLGSFPVFDKVDLRYTQLSSSPADEVQRVTFEIGAHLKPGRPANPAAGEQKDPAQQAVKGEDNGKPNA